MHGLEANQGVVVKAATDLPVWLDSLDCSPRRLKCTNSVAGRQRLQLDLFSLQPGQDLSQAHQTITADAAPTCIPLEAGQGLAYWPLRVWRRYDAFGLAREATSLFTAMAPKVGLGLTMVGIHYGWGSPWLGFTMVRVHQIPASDDCKANKARQSNACYCLFAVGKLAKVCFDTFSMQEMGREELVSLRPGWLTYNLHLDTMLHLWPQVYTYVCKFTKGQKYAFQVRQLQGDPLALSYWLASNLPLEDDTRQRLLEAPTVVERWVVEQYH